jgi:hypothetical protein
LICKPRQGLIELVKRRMFLFFVLKQLVLFVLSYCLLSLKLITWAISLVNVGLSTVSVLWISGFKYYKLLLLK